MKDEKPLRQCRFGEVLEIAQRIALLKCGLSRAPHGGVVSETPEKFRPQKRSFEDMP